MFYLGSHKSAPIAARAPQCGLRRRRVNSILEIFCNRKQNGEKISAMRCIAAILKCRNPRVHGLRCRGLRRCSIYCGADSHNYGAIGALLCDPQFLITTLTVKKNNIPFEDIFAQNWHLTQLLEFTTEPEHF